MEAFEVDRLRETCSKEVARTAVFEGSLCQEGHCSFFTDCLGPSGLVVGLLPDARLLMCFRSGALQEPGQIEMFQPRLRQLRNQIWDWLDTKQLKNRYGLCMDAPHPHTEGSRVHMWTCRNDLSALDLAASEARSMIPYRL